MKKPTAVKKAQTPDLAQVLAELQAQLAALTARLDRLEAGAAPAPAREPEARLRPPRLPRLPPRLRRTRSLRRKPDAPGISEEEILAVSAALAATWGCGRGSSPPARLAGLAAQGRVSIQASHRLHNRDDFDVYPCT